MQYEDLSELTKISLRFYSELSAQHGKDKAGEAFSALNDVLGIEWSREFFKWILLHGTARGIEITHLNEGAPIHPGNYTNVFISTIKEVRAAFQLGLAETKNLIDQVREGKPVKIFFNPETKDIETRSYILITNLTKLGVDAELI